MPSFDVVSEVDLQEVRNAVDQVSREVTTRYDFKDTNSSIELQRPRDQAPRQHRGPPRGAPGGARGEARAPQGVVEGGRLRQGRGGVGGTARQVVTLNAGISSDKARELNKFIKELGLKGVQSQAQGDQLRVTGKKRDDLQAAIAALREGDFGVPLQFENFRD